MMMPGPEAIVQNGVMECAEHAVEICSDTTKADPLDVDAWGCWAHIELPSSPKQLSEDVNQMREICGRVSTNATNC